jgi:Spy/CpxP family protein refolding chaperone
MKLAKWAAMVAAAGIAAGGIVVVRARAAEGAQLGAVLETGGARGLSGRVAQELDLTKDERKQIRSVLASDRDKIVTLVTAVHDARINLRQTIRTAGVTEIQVRDASAKVASAESDLAVERSVLYGKISPILTAEQLTKLSDLQERADEAVDGAIGVLGRRLAE